VSREQVLVIPAEALEPLLPRFEGGVMRDGQGMLLLNTAIGHHARFVDREAAETDESVKQVIPYCVLTRPFAGEPMYFAYRRTKKGGERRLHEKWSVGIGGHISPADGDGKSGDVVYVNGLLRELREEVGLDARRAGPAWGSDPTWDAVVGPVAAIYDPSNEVGRVHLGLVHLIPVEDGWTPQSNDPALAMGYFTFRHILAAPRSRGDFENWSAIVYDKLLAA
jgi:predicted NUDIX family phosphoesterase